MSQSSTPAGHRSEDKKATESGADKDAAVNGGLSADDKRELFRQMLRIRRFEERALRAYQAGKIGGFLHLYIGQEAVAVGALSVAGENDHCITAYRDHGHALMAGMSMRECMAELFGKITGCSKGKGGSMHFFAPDKRYWGGHGIVAGQTPLGAGIAFALKYREIDGCCLCFMGEGAVNQGAFHESLNLAALWKLPVVYIIENNRYSMGTSQQRSSAGIRLAKRAEGYDMAWGTCNGHDIYAVRAETRKAIDRAHTECLPTVLEIDTYRYRGHSVSDPDKTYRSKEEIEDYRKMRDPITLYRDILFDEGVADEDSVKQMDQEIRQETEDAFKFADSSPFPDAEDIVRNVYWEEDNPDAKQSKGVIFFETP